MKVKLVDGAPRSNAEVSIIVSKNGNTLEVGVDGTVAPIVIEYYEGKVRLRVYGIDPTTPVFTRDLDATVATLSMIDKPASEPSAVAAANPPEGKVFATSSPSLAGPAPVVTESTDDDDMAAFDAA